MPDGDAEPASAPRTSPRRAALAAGLVHGLILAAAFPPIGLYGLVFLAPLPLVWVTLVGRHKPLVTAFWVGVGTMPWWALAHIWITSVSALGFVPLAIALAGYTALAVWIAARVLRFSPALIGLWPVLWVGVEFLRGVVLFHGYPWYLLAHPLADAAVLTWPAALFGTFAVSLLAAVPATALAAWRTGHPRQAAGLALVAVAWPALGLVANPWPDAAGSIRVGIVQTNVPQSRKVAWSAEQRDRDWGRMRRLIAGAAADHPDLIVLPEAMAPGMTLDPASFRTEVEADLFWGRTGADGVEERVPATMLTEELLLLQRALDIPIMIGGAAYDNLRIVEADVGYNYESDARFNAAFVIDEGLPPSERYDKVLLTPFGETMPYISASPWLERQLLAFGASGMQFDLKAGTTLEPVTVRLADGSTVRIATPICFEATMPWVCRRLVTAEPRADIMINLTNDGWFGRWTPSRQHHLLCARWRSIEDGVAMVRCANTGISCVFDQRGRVIALGVADPETGAPVLDLAEGVRTVEVPIADGRTLYTRIGDILGWLCLAGTAALAALSFTRFGRAGRSDGQEPEPGEAPARSDRQPEEHR
jgi:apolipoprotein N-acyltransferase